MENVTFEVVDGNRLVIEIDLNHRGDISASGKTRRVASTEGNIGSTKIRGVKLDAVAGDPGVSGHGAYESRPGAKLPSSIDPTDFGASLDDTNRRIDDPGTQVGEILQCDHRRKLNGPFAFPVVVRQYAGTGSRESEPRAMTQRIAPRPELVEPPAQLGPDGMRNPSVFPQQLVEPVDQSEHGVGPVTLHLGVPLQVRLNLVGL